MRRFIVERTIPGVGGAELPELRAIARRGQAANRTLAPDVQWVESFIADDKTYCVYLAKDETAVRRHSEMAGFPMDEVSEVKGVIDPATAGG